MARTPRLTAANTRSSKRALRYGIAGQCLGDGLFAETYVGCRAGLWCLRAVRGGGCWGRLAMCFFGDAVEHTGPGMDLSSKPPARVKSRRGLRSC